MKTLLWAALLCLVGHTLSAQNISTFNLQFNQPMLVSNNQVFCVDIEIANATENDSFQIGSHTIWIDYNKDCLSQPIYYPQNFCATALCDMDELGYYSPFIHTAYSYAENGLKGAFNLTSSLGGYAPGNCMYINATWQNVGQICFTVINPQLSAQLIFNNTKTICNTANNLQQHLVGNLQHLDITPNTLIATPTTTLPADFPPFSCRNTTSGEVFLRLYAPQYELATLMLFDLSGRIVEQQSIQTSPNCTDWLPISFQAPYSGTYIYQCRFNNHIYSGKIALL